MAHIVRADVRRAVQDLPEKQRWVTLLFYFVDLSVSEVAQVMECAIGTVKSNLHDARTNLAESLGATYVES